MLSPSHPISEGDLYEDPGSELFENSSLGRIEKICLAEESGGVTVKGKQKKTTAVMRVWQVF